MVMWTVSVIGAVRLSDHASHWGLEHSVLMVLGVVEINGAVAAMVWKIEEVVGFCPGGWIVVGGHWSVAQSTGTLSGRPRCGSDVVIGNV